MALRLGALLVTMPAGAGFAVLVADWPTVIGNGPGSSNMYSSLALPWTAGRLLADQQTAAQWTLGLGEVALLVAVAALIWRWNRRSRDTPPPWPSGVGTPSKNVTSRHGADPATAALTRDTRASRSTMSTTCAVESAPSRGTPPPTTTAHSATTAAAVGVDCSARPRHPGGRARAATAPSTPPVSALDGLSRRSRTGGT
jgi:hypothetical protein